VLLAVAIGSFFLKTTLAANVTINNGIAVEFGQGASATTSCSGSNNLNLKPNSTFTNSGGSTGSFYFKSVTVSGIPTSCNGQDFKIKAYQNLSSTPLSIFNSSGIEAIIYDVDGSSFVGGYGSNGLTISGSSGSFTVTFDSPVSLATTVTKLTLESASHTPWLCVDGGPCSLGDKGPGGGTIFYVSSGFTEVGAPCASACHYLEWAPNTWSGGSSDAQISNWSSDYLANHQAQPNDITGAGSGDVSTGSGALGQGFINTQRMLTSNGTTGYVADSSGAAYQVSRYAGNDNSAGKWFLPSVGELLAIKASSIFSSGGFLTAPLPDSANPLYWSSSESDWQSGGHGTAWYVFLLNSARQIADKAGDNHFFVRPIRAF